MSMAHCLNQNVFTSKKTMPTVCTIARSNYANMTVFKANAGVGNTSTTSTVCSIYFDEKPRVHLKFALNSSKVQTKSSATSSTDDYLWCSRSNPGARLMPSFSPSGEIGEHFTTWLTGSGGVYKKDGPAQHIVSRCLKFLKFCC